MSSYQHLLSVVYGKPWLITATGHASICDLLDRKIAGTLSKREDGEDICGDAVEVQQMTIKDGCAIIPVGGVLGNKLGKYERGAGCVDYLDIINEIKDAGSQTTVECILLDFDSPGGTVSGIYECAAAISECRKPTYSFISGMCCSAAYWLAASTNHIFSTPSSDVGSIGVYVPWVDRSRQYSEAGIDVTLFTSGKFKGMGYPGVALTPDQAKYLQDYVDDLASDFKLHVSDKRPNIDPSAMEGQSFMASKSSGFVDEFCNNITDCLMRIR